MKASLLRGFSSFCQISPDSVAVINGQEQINYQELNHYSEKIADTIRATKAHKVGVLMERSINSIASFIAIVQSNTSYYPFNTLLNLDYLTKLMCQAQLDLIICTSDTLALARSTGIDCFNIETNSLERFGNEPTYFSSEYKNIVYSIFTSGSTGKPKQVLISVDNLNNHQQALTSALKLTHQDKVLHCCSLSFDVSIEEVLTTLNAGATVVILAALENTSMQALNDFIAHHSISIANLPTAIWNNWVDILMLGTVHPPKSLKTIVIGSEACPVSSFNHWQSLDYQDITMINAYGLSETTITNSLWPFKECGKSHTKCIPIGKPIAGNEFFIVDDNDRFVDNGNSGELVITGQQIGCYSSTSELSKKSGFITLTDHSGQKKKAFRTGDIARINQDGDYEILARKDHQVKINGYRIECSLIENLLEQHKNINRCIVRAISRHGSKVLVAYVTGNLALNTPWNNLVLIREHQQFSKFYHYLSDKLPQYSIPLYFCPLTELPLSVNGKINLAQLPIFNTEKLSTNTTFIQSSLEEVFANLLNSSADLAQHSFIALGGDSIVAQGLITQCLKLGWRIELALLLSNLTIKTVIDSAEKISRPAPLEECKTVKPFTGKGMPKALLLTLYKQKPLWESFSYARKATPTQKLMLSLTQASPNSGDFIEQVEGRLPIENIELFQQAWTQVIKYHEPLRSGFLFQQGDAFVCCFKHFTPTWTINDVYNQDFFDDEVVNFLSIDRKKGFNNLLAPLYRFQLFRVSAEQVHFVWSYHHAILDGWSDVMILDQVFESYQQLLQKTTVKIDNNAATYREFLEYIESLDHRTGETYWLEHLKKSTLSRLTPKLMTAKRDEQEFTISITKDEWQEIGRLQKKSGVTLSAMCQAASAMAICEATGKYQWTYANVHSIRPHELEQVHLTSGLFINFLPTSVSIRPEDTIINLARAVQATNLRHQEYACSFDMLDILNHHNHLAHGLDYDVAIVYENYPQSKQAITNQLKSHAQSGLPVTIYFWPSQEYLNIQIKYWSSAIHHVEIARLAALIIEKLSSGE